MLRELLASAWLLSTVVQLDSSGLQPHIRVFMHLTSHASSLSQVSQHFCIPPDQVWCCKAPEQPMSRPTKQPKKAYKRVQSPLNALKNEIERLYVVEGWTLERIREHIRASYGLDQS